MTKNHNTRPAHAGKTMDELIAEQVVKTATPRDSGSVDQPRKRTIELSQAEYDRVETGLPDAVGYLRDAHDIFALLEDLMIRDAIDTEDPGVIAVLRHCKRSFQFFEKTEASALELLDRRLREEQSRYQNAKEVGYEHQ